MAPTIHNAGPPPQEALDTGAPVRRFRLSAAEWTILLAVLLFCAVTRLYGITDFPIYFFCDEAHQGNLAQDLVSNGFRDQDGNFAPIYFRNVRVFNLGLSVWIHAAPVAIFGKTIFVVRATSVAVGLLGTAALMLALKWFFGVRLWWAAGLIMAALPAWFLHSRTAFETAMMVGFYCTFVLTYLLYREVSAWWLPAAIVSGAATFYSYSNGQGVMFISCLLLLVVDWRYHWRVVTHHRRATAAALVVAFLVAAPYLRFHHVLHPEMMEVHFDDLNSHWVEDISTRAKAAHFAAIYLRGLGPGYWFTEDAEDLERHRMLGYPHVPVWLAPLTLLGLGVSLRRSIRSPAHRLVLIAVLAAPFSASLVGLRITRVLAMMVPVTLAATIGIDQLRRWLAPLVRERVLAAVVGPGLMVAALTMTADALINGPLWFQDYGMHGLQWGAKELFTDVRRRLASAPKNHEIVVSHLWANNADAFDVFFLTPEERQRFEWGSIDTVLRERRYDVGPKRVFIFTPEEFEQALTDPKLFIDPDFSTIPDPAGRPGFYIVRLSYTPAADRIFATERAERRKLVKSVVTINGKEVSLDHPKLDTGEIQEAFDGNLKSLARTLDGNPTNLVLAFPEPRALGGVRLHLWTEHYRIRVRATLVDGEVVEIVRTVRTGLPPEPIEMSFIRPVREVTLLEFEIRKEGDEHVHMREIELLE